MPFKKGEGGRPAGATNRATRDIKAELDALARDGNKDRHFSRLQKLSESADEHVAIKALSLILAYRCGKPPESISLTGPNDGPLLVKFVDA